jgi:hypothetical protein
MNDLDKPRKVYLFRPEGESGVDNDLKLLRGLSRLEREQRIEVVSGNLEMYPSARKYCNSKEIDVSPRRGALIDLQCEIVAGNLAAYKRIACVLERSENDEEIEDFAEFLRRNDVLSEVRKIS